VYLDLDAERELEFTVTAADLLHRCFGSGFS